MVSAECYMCSHIELERLVSVFTRGDGVHGFKFWDVGLCSNFL